MADKRFKNTTWDLGDGKGNIDSWEQAKMAVLYDIRDELQTLNRVLACPNFTAIPTVLRTIRRNTSGLRPPKKTTRSRKV
jgi:hypothetical protein